MKTHETNSVCSYWLEYYAVFILAVITPAWIYFTGESFFLANMLEFAEVPLGNESGLTAPTFKPLALLAILLFTRRAFRLGDLAGDPRHSIRQKTHHSEPRPGAEGKKIALAMLGMGPCCRCFASWCRWFFYWPHPYTQIVLYLAILSCC